MIWLCIKSVVVDGQILFAKGGKYEGELKLAPDQITTGVLFSQTHLMFGTFLHNHFIKICPECEQGKAEVDFNQDDYICNNCVLNNLEME